MTDQNASNDIFVTAAKGATRGLLQCGALAFPCALGRSGIVTNKHEGDGGTPTGTWALRELRYRPDRISAPTSILDTFPITASDGWCDGPGDPAYNRFVKLPYPASHERLMRDDHLYDIVIMLGYNDAPVIDGKGSAIFFHCAKLKDQLLQPTEGCVALLIDDLKTVLGKITATTRMVISLEV